MTRLITAVCFIPDNFVGNGAPASVLKLIAIPIAAIAGGALGAVLPCYVVPLVAKGTERALCGNTGLPPNVGAQFAIGALVGLAIAIWLCFIRGR
jgi:hypothetical protein